MIETRAEQIVGRLSVGQKSCIRNLDAEPSILGCAEPFAKRLAVAKAHRPALVEMTKAKGDSYARFSLTEYGLRIKSMLEKT